MGVYSDGSYGIQPGIIYSFPVTCEKGQWSIVHGKFPLRLRCHFCIVEQMAMAGQHFHYLNAMTGLKIDELSREKMDATTKELVEEKSLAYSCLY